MPTHPILVAAAILYAPKYPSTSFGFIGVGFTYALPRAEPFIGVGHRSSKDGSASMLGGVPLG